jgi:hypothetical protein
MRDLLNKLDAIVSETALKDKEDLAAKRKALQDLQMDPTAAEDPEIKQAIIQRKADLEKEAKAKGFSEGIQLGDDFGISFNEDFEIESSVVGFVKDGIVIELDEFALDLLEGQGFSFLEGYLKESEKQKGVDGKACWKGYRRMGTKKKGGKTVDNCVKVSEGFGSLEDEVKSLLKRFEENAMEIGAYGDPDVSKVVAMLRQGDFEGATEEVWSAYSDQDGGEVPRLEPYVDDLQDEFEELAQGGDEDEGGDTDDAYALASAGHGSDEDYGDYGFEEDHSEDPEDPANRGEYDNEGDMAKDDLRTINDAAKELYNMLDVDDNLPEWVQSKINKAADYIDTARDYMKSNSYTEGRYPFAGRKVGQKEGPAGQLKGKDPAGYPKGKLVGGSESVEHDLDEADYRGRKVQLGKKLPGDVKKYKVYVRKPNGNIVKVNFGDKKMRIKKSNPSRRKSFRARHRCSNPGPRWKARYWSCRNW